MMMGKYGQKSRGSIHTPQTNQLLFHIILVYYQMCFNSKKTQRKTLEAFVQRSLNDPKLVEKYKIDTGTASSHTIKDLYSRYKHDKEQK